MVPSRTAFRASERRRRRLANRPEARREAISRLARAHGAADIRLFERDPEHPRPAPRCAARGARLIAVERAAPLSDDRGVAHGPAGRYPDKA